MGDLESIAEVYGDGKFETNLSIYQLLERGLNANRNGPAVISVLQPSGHLKELTGDEGSQSENPEDCLVWTHAQLHRAATLLALSLQARGVQPGSTLVTLMSNRAEWVLLFVAAALLQLTIVSLDFGALGPGRRSELETILDILKPGVVVVASETDVDAVDAALPALEGTGTMKIALDKPVGDAAGTSWMNLLEIAIEPLPSRDQQTQMIEKARMPDPDRICLIVFTSGTSSGASKGCPRTVANSTTVSEALDPNFGMDAHTRFLLSSANFRVIAPVLSLTVLKRGGTLVIPGPAFDPKGCLEAIDKHSISHILLVPAQLHMLADDPTFSQSDHRSVQLASVGADIITLDVLAKASKMFPSARVYTGHGMSEGGGLFLWPFFKTPVMDIPNIGGISPLGTVGPGTGLRIVDVEKGCVAKRNQPGELHISTPASIRRYLRDEEPGTFYEDSQGPWLKTGDQALITKDGLVFILGRYSQSFKRAGISITPAALEACLERYTGTQTAVVGISHSVLGREPFAIVKDFNDKTADQIKAEIVNVFGKDSALGGVASIQQIGLDNFPLNTTGKVQKSELQKAVEAYLNG